MTRGKAEAESTAAAQEESGQNPEAGYAVQQLLAAATALKRLPRTGWLMKGVVQPESVAAHSYSTSVLAMLLAELVNQAPAAQGLAGPVDVGRVAQIALIHDLAESKVTDLPHRATRLLGKDVKYRAEERAMRELGEAWPDGDHLLGLWQEYATQASPEARLVRDADKLELVHQALEYTASGQRHLDEFWQGHEWHYPLSLDLYRGLLADYLPDFAANGRGDAHGGGRTGDV